MISFSQSKSLLLSKLGRDTTNHNVRAGSEKQDQPVGLRSVSAKQILPLQWISRKWQHRHADQISETHMTDFVVDVVVSIALT